MIYLGIDCGTQSTKTVALDAGTGSIIASAAQSYGILTDLPPGHMEQDPVTWVEAMDATIRQVVETLGARRDEIRGIGVSGQQHGFVPLDKYGRIIRPAKLWCDTSTVEECDLIRNHFGGARALTELIGLDMLPGYTAPKILWLKRNEPENFARLAHVLLPHEYLNYCLTGKYGMEYGDASGTALMNIRARTWAGSILDFIDPGLAEKLPPLHSSRQPAGTLKRELTKRWNLPAEIVISAGGGDNMMAAIGTANTAPGRVTASLGTSGTIYAYSAGPVIDPEGEIAGFCDSTDAWLPLVCTMNVTVATEAVRTMLDWSHGQIEEAVRVTPAGCDGLLFLPYLQGERTPNLPHGTGVYHGLTTGNMTPGHLARAAMEGATLGLAYGLKRLRALGLSPTEIRLTGGGSKSAIWRQICADVFACRTVTLAEPEGAALGAAIQALAAAQTEKPIHDWAEQIVQITGSTEPREKLSSDYAAALEKQIALTRALVERGFL
ncbi:MAG TPA: xylulokinase [Candidatus Methylacidiphilales bacterium]|nr:xylulokinase [Candidatus Methylacidiphilales bacterium]